MKPRSVKLLYLLLALTLLSGCNERFTKMDITWTEEVAAADVQAVLDCYQPQLELDWLSTLTSPEYGGRVSCSAEEDAAGLFIAEILQDLDLEPWVAAGLTGYHHAFEVAGQRQMAENVIAVLPGETVDQFLLFTAHYDHIQGAQPEQYPGADDNASGTVALLSAAKAMVDSGLKPERSIVFIFFSAEERGLLGSKALLRQLRELNLTEQCVVLNLEMLAGQQGNKLTVLDEGKAELNGALSERAMSEIESSGLQAYQFAGASGRMDSMSFTPAGIPAISLFWGNIETDHPFYHTPSDTFASVQADILEQATRAAIRVAWTFAFCTLSPVSP